MGRSTKTIFVGSDGHSGHERGLTHPDWHWPDSEQKHRSSVARFQRWSWAFFKEIIERHGKFDILLFNGDAIDGKGERSGGTELITADRNEQCNIAIECLKEVGAEQNLLTYGTPYHTGKDEDFEKIVADGLNGTIHPHAYIDINGVVISMKHKVGNTSIPHGKGTAILKQQMWNDAWCREYESHPRANVFIRSHVHWYMAIDQGNTLSFVTPALQGMGSKFGSRQCDSVVDFGALVLRITPAGSITWTKELATLEGQPVSTIKL
jgi:hypothetical protein